MQTTTGTRKISDSAALADYTLTAGLVVALTVTLDETDAYSDYREPVENAWMEQLHHLDELMQHPALASLTEAELEALAA